MTDIAGIQTAQTPATTPLESTAREDGAEITSEVNNENVRNESADEGIAAQVLSEVKEEGTKTLEALKGVAKDLEEELALLRAEKVVEDRKREIAALKARIVNQPVNVKEEVAQQPIATQQVSNPLGGVKAFATPSVPQTPERLTLSLLEKYLPVT